MLGRLDEHWPGLERPLHLAELVFDLREAVELLDHLAIAHFELGGDDLVVAHEIVELRELRLVDHRRQVRRIDFLARGLVDVLLFEEAPQPLAARGGDAVAAGILPELPQELHERHVLVPLALVERLAPVHDNFLPDLVLLAVLVLHNALHYARLVPEVLADDGVALGVDGPCALRLVRLPEAFRDYVAVARLAHRVHVRPRIHAAVRDKDKAPDPEVARCLVHRGPERVVVERVSGEGREGDRDAVAVEEEPELHDWLPAVLLADAELPQPRDYVPIRILEVLVRPCGLEEEVRHVVEHGARART